MDKNESPRRKRTGYHDGKNFVFRRKRRGIHSSSTYWRIKSAYKKSKNIYDDVLTQNKWWSKLYINLFGGVDDNLLAKKVLDFIPANFKGKLLDVPVGTGIFTAGKYTRLQQADITCIDYSDAMLELAVKNFSKEKHKRKLKKTCIIIPVFIISVNCFGINRGMVILKDSVEISTPLDSLYEWFAELNKNFVAWHPNHLKFELVSGGNDVGDKIYFEEIVNGILYAIKGTITKKEKTADNFVVEFKSAAGLGHISFIGRKNDNGCIFTHIEKFGISTPLIGNLINFLLFKVIARKKANWDLILKDMREDNVRLKKIMEQKEIFWKKD